MKPAIVDLHCHLDLYPDLPGAIARCSRLNAYVLSVTTTPKAWRKTKALAPKGGRIRTALGLHPQLALERKGELALFEALIPETRYLGEIGLDGGPDCKAFWKEQISVFEHILQVAAKAGGRLMSLHSRHAAGAVLDSLARYPDAGIPVLHWFTGSKAELERAVAMGCWFSVGPAMLKSRSGRERAAAMPRDRVMTETDGPFAQVDGRPLTPGEVAAAHEILGSIWQMEPTETALAVLDNFQRFTSSQVGGPSAGTMI